MFFYKYIENNLVYIYILKCNLQVNFLKFILMIYIKRLVFMIFGF